MNIKRTVLVLVLVLVSVNVIIADIHLPEMFQDGMVLQRGKDIAVWGTADAGESITISWKKKDYIATADSKGRWQVILPKTEAGGPYVMAISDGTGNKKVINDILVGDVWMVSGQSNIDVTVERIYPQYSKDINQYGNDRIRLLRVQKNPQTKEQTDILKDHWRHANKKEACDFSAVGYFLAREMYEKTKGVPQGIICNSVGGSPIQAWVDLDSVKTFSPEYYQKYLLYTDKDYVCEQYAANNRANELWAKMVNDSDPGIREDWTGAKYDDSSWPTVNQYKISSFSLKEESKVGSFWLRQHVTIDKAHAGKPAKLLLGRIYDQDFTFVNGKQVGVTWYQYPPRRYDIPEGLLHEGDNVISVRIVNKGGMPEFFPEKPYKIVFGDWCFDGKPECEIPLSENWKGHVGAQVTECLGGKTDYQNQASVLYNGMVCPVAPYTLNGVVWYQGESNVGPDAGNYGTMLRMLMSNWRGRFSDEKLPFVITQIANYLQPVENPQNSYMAVIREQQRLTANADPMARVVTTIDLGETYDIHPLRKQEVAQRIAAAFGNMVWGEDNPLSPQPIAIETSETQELSTSTSSATRETQKLIITMDQPLQSGQLHEFELAGADGKYYNATAVADGSTITVTCNKVKDPVSLRYAWKDNPIHADCKGKTGLPAVPFEACPEPVGWVSALSQGQRGEDGHSLWLRMTRNTKDATVQTKGVRKTAVVRTAIDELHHYWHGGTVILVSPPKGGGGGSIPEDDGYSIEMLKDKTVRIASKTDCGLLYGAYALLRLQETSEPQTSDLITSKPKYNLRILNHWDNPDGTCERGFAGHSIFWKVDGVADLDMIKEYGRANASIGINATVLNNVNAKPWMLREEKLQEVKRIADALRPYGIRVFLSVNFASPMDSTSSPTGIGLPTADPLDKDVIAWWKAKAKEIYKMIPDFGGFLVKANSEGEPGPMDFHRSHADGANMLADALTSAWQESSKPYNRTTAKPLVMWRAFVYSATGGDRASQAVQEFMPYDGMFRDNVIIQIKNGPIDFQPREPVSPLFFNMKKTNMMAEFQITQEYTGESIHTCFLAPMWIEFFQTLKGCYVNIDSLPLTGGQKGGSAIAGVANIGDMRNWCGSDMAQANWYAFGRLAWDDELCPRKIAEEWLEQTYTKDTTFVNPMTDVLCNSHEAVVHYMMPLGLHHIFAGGHHYGPEPWYYVKGCREDWLPRFYHKADSIGIGFDRTLTGSNNVCQYPEPLRSKYYDIEKCPEQLLLWFHHTPWNHRMHNGETLWEALCHTYDQGVREAEAFAETWRNMKPYVDNKRWEAQLRNFSRQAKDAWWWRDACLLYFQTFSRQKLPIDCPAPRHNLNDLQRFHLDMDNYTRADFSMLPF